MAAIVGAALLQPAVANAQAVHQREAEFQQLAAQLAEQRVNGGEEKPEPQERALAILDGIVLEALNRSARLDREALNQTLAPLVSDESAIGESYQIMPLGGDPPAFVLLANFGLSGPSAVRIYARRSTSFRLADRIDRFARPAFLDEYLELVPLDVFPGVFVTVMGRTDGLRTGVFTAWRFDGERATQLWTSDLLPQSSYESARDGFRLTYCAESDVDHPRVCRRMVRDLYTWDGMAWKLLNRTELPKVQK